MAYPKSTPVTPKPSAQGSGRLWEDLRREARLLESEADVKLAAFGKLCAGYESGYAAGESGLAADQLAQSKSSEIEGVLARLTDVNEEMRTVVGVGGGGARGHTLARHRDILRDYAQEFRRLSSLLGAARDRADLLGGSGGSGIHGGAHGGLHGGPGMSLLLRERGMLASSSAAIDDVLGAAHAVAGGLAQQRQLFDGIGSKITAVGARFPVVNSLLNAIRRKKSRDNVILASVVAICTFVILVYWANK